MCSANVKIVLISFLTLGISSGYAIDTSEQEKICKDIGFKQKTEAFGNCVLELLSREARQSQSSQNSEVDDATCRGYGFKPKSVNYSECRQKIDTFKAEAQQRQTIYEAQKKQYDEQVADIERERKKQASMKTFAYSMGLLSGQTPMQAYGTSQGYPPSPQPPTPMNQTFVFPGGRSMNCTTVGGTTNCF